MLRNTISRIIRTSPRSALASTRQQFQSIGRRSRVDQYLRSHTVRKLQIGAGFHAFEGWLNTDLEPRNSKIMFMDATRRFPIPDGSFDYVFTEHIIEHIPYNAGRVMAAECFRVLRSGGRIRIATPDLQRLLGLYSPEKSEIQQRYLNWITGKFLHGVDTVHECFVLNNAFRNWGHEFLYDQHTLAALLGRVGFTDLVWCEPSESSDPALANIDSHGSCIQDQDMNRFESMIIEARKA